MGEAIGYHKREIQKHKFGTAAKVMEEAEEFIDSVDQGVRLMALQELSDIIGAIDGFLQVNYDGSVTLEDLIDMANVTKRAFVSGRRK